MQYIAHSVDNITKKTVENANSFNINVNAPERVEKETIQKQINK